MKSRPNQSIRLSLFTNIVFSDINRAGWIAIKVRNQEYNWFTSEYIECIAQI